MMCKLVHVACDLSTLYEHFTVCANVDKLATDFKDYKLETNLFGLS